jgi:hypothetical protein
MEQGNCLKIQISMLKNNTKQKTCNAMHYRFLANK